MDQIETIIKKLKKVPLNDQQKVHDAFFDIEDIKKIIPHRDPFLLIDKVTGMNSQSSLITGERYIKEDDPVFVGHFPDKPVYPGVLQIEIVAQLGLCLSYFMVNDTKKIDNKSKPIFAMITKIHHASYIRPVLPKQLLSVYCNIIDYNEITGLIVGQIYNDDKLSSCFILEAYFND